MYSTQWTNLSTRKPWVRQKLPINWTCKNFFIYLDFQPHYFLIDAAQTDINWFIVPWRFYNMMELKNKLHGAYCLLVGNHSGHNLHTWGWGDMKTKGQPNWDSNTGPPSQGSNHATNWANEAGPEDCRTNYNSWAGLGIVYWTFQEEEQPIRVDVEDNGH